ncbi:MAG TPA: twin-arginine translocase TatA/TatE family subunit [Thermoanaerobaculia bacterium]
MIGSLGLPELAFIFILALLVFGPRKLPEIGRTIGRGLAEFRKATNELKRTLNTEIALEENPVPPAAVRPQIRPAEAPREVVAREKAAPAVEPQTVDPQPVEPQ